MNKLRNLAAVWQERQPGSISFEGVLPFEFLRRIHAHTCASSHDALDAHYNRELSAEMRVLRRHRAYTLRLRNFCFVRIVSQFLAAVKTCSTHSKTSCKLLLVGNGLFNERRLGEERFLRNHPQSASIQCISMTHVKAINSRPWFYKISVMFGECKAIRKEISPLNFPTGN